MMVGLNRRKEMNTRHHYAPLNLTEIHPGLADGHKSSFASMSKLDQHVEKEVCHEVE